MFSQTSALKGKKALNHQHTDQNKNDCRREQTCHIRFVFWYIPIRERGTFLTLAGCAEHTTVHFNGYTEIEQPSTHWYLITH